jgi:putative spermidine/putrescine transport system permease protein
MSSRRDLERVGLALFFLLAVVPVGASLVYAAFYAFGLTGLLAHGFTLSHARAAFLTSSEVSASLLLSVYVAAAVVVLTAGVALPLSLVLRRRLEGRLLSAVLSLPLALPGLVAASLVWHLLGGAGPVSRVAFRLGLIRGIGDFPSPVQDAWGAGIILTHSALAIPFFVLLFTEIDRAEKLPALLELAAALGASPRQAATRIRLPLLLKKAFPTLALLFVVVLGSYEVPLVLGRAYPQMVSLLVLRRYAMFDITLKPEAFILALGYAALVLVILKIAFRRKGLRNEP